MEPKVKPQKIKTTSFAALLTIKTWKYRTYSIANSLNPKTACTTHQLH